MLRQQASLSPLSSIQGRIGGKSSVSIIQSVGRGHEYHRRWECGCSVVYYDSPYQTARWRACDAHTTRKPLVAASVRSNDPIPESLATVEQRHAPRFFLLDQYMNVVATSPGEAISELVQTALRTAPSWVKGTPSIVPLNDDLYLRVIPLSGAWSDVTAVFFESVNDRGSIAAAARRFGLSKREIDVLRLVISNYSNADIAKRLFIAESTVGDHIKSLFRKMGAKRRTEVLTKIFQRDS
jgi:DNA-binding CsgD family transcriptional regulator